jgi:hypothetical protein
MFEYALGVLSGVILSAAVPAVYGWGKRAWAKRGELKL